jgi:hypothetical protein
MNPDPSMEACAKVCHECEDACLRTIVHCLDRGGEHASRSHQTMLADCAAICSVSHSFLHRGSPLHGHTCAACAAVCRACAEDCEHTAADDETMIRCARACRACAESCERMAAPVRA